MNIFALSKRFFRERAISARRAALPLIAAICVAGACGAEVPPAEEIGDIPTVRVCEAEAVSMSLFNAHVFHIVFLGAILLTVLFWMHRHYRRYVFKKGVAICSGLPLRIVVADGDGNILFIKSDAARATQAKHVSALAHDGRDMMEIIARVLKTGRSEFILLHDRAADRVFREGYTKIDASAFGKACVLIFAADITKEYLQSEALNRNNALLQDAVNDARAANEGKSFFLATMSHELRTPLNAIIGYTELLRAPSMSEGERRDALRAVDFSANALLGLINDILDLSKLEANEVRLESAPVDFKALVLDVAHMLRARAERQGCAITVDFENDIPAVLLLDYLRVRQVLFNLAGNAVKFTRDGAVALTVGFAPRGRGCGDLTVRVIDTGVGIAPADLESIFQPFIQSTSRVRGRRAFEGTGLGLSIARKLVRMMGGDITVESEHGKGSTFTVSLKNAACAPAGTEPINHESPHTRECGAPSRFQGEVLVVDDVDMNVRILGALLSKLGVRHRAAASAAEALQLLKTWTPDLILTDLWMPQMSGGQFAEKLSQSPQWRGIPRVAVTADTRTEDLKRTGLFADFLLKPITLERLRNLLNTVDWKRHSVAS